MNTVYWPSDANGTCFSVGGLSEVFEHPSCGSNNPKNKHLNKGAVSEARDVWVRTGTLEHPWTEYGFVTIVRKMFPSIDSTQDNIVVEPW